MTWNILPRKSLRPNLKTIAQLQSYVFDEAILRPETFTAAICGEVTTIDLPLKSELAENSHSSKRKYIYNHWCLLSACQISSIDFSAPNSWV